MVACTNIFKFLRKHQSTKKIKYLPTLLSFISFQTMNWWNDLSICWRSSTTRGRWCPWCTWYWRVPTGTSKRRTGGSTKVWPSVQSLGRWSARSNRHRSVPTLAVAGLTNKPPPLEFSASSNPQTVLTGTVKCTQEIRLLSERNKLARGGKMTSGRTFDVKLLPTDHWSGAIVLDEWKSTYTVTEWVSCEVRSRWELCR